MSLLQQQSLVQKIKLFCLPHIMLSIETITITNKHTKKSIFQKKMPICKDQRIDYFLLINNVPDFKKMSVPFLSNNNNNLFLNSNSLFELSQYLS